MSHNVDMLPSFPCSQDMWDILACEKRPIVVYGMGNGADKLIKRFEKYDIEIADFFASDGFVRGHNFHGKRVKSFSEIKSQYSEFVIVLSFASNRAEVIEMLSNIDASYEMYVPDMPVAGEEEYFDRDFYNSHYSEIVSAYEGLYDKKSQEIFASVIKYKLSGKMHYLMSASCSLDEMYSIVPCDKIENAIDAGAYNGDTAREMKKYFSNLKNIVAIEPDVKNFSKLLKYCEAETDIIVFPINAAAWSENEILNFSSSGNRNSTAVATTSYQHKDLKIKCLRLDSIEREKTDYIKFDVEGGEMRALRGSEKIIISDKPTMLVSVYHRSSDIFAIANFIKSNYPFYKIYLRRLKCVPAWELNLILIPADFQ